jgi:hypothetical protein
MQRLREVSNLISWLFTNGATSLYIRLSIDNTFLLTANLHLLTLLISEPPSEWLDLRVMPLHPKMPLVH